ncbi:hypothetical protein Sjap_022249 [Stephania japonica]|uniref:Uncharacterized protein n=1 Tax=Stephania japonica TaxID=461633 RepID=A0AAP0ETX4_9MAGN
MADIRSSLLDLSSLKFSCFRAPGFPSTLSSRKPHGLVFVTSSFSRSPQRRSSHHIFAKPRKPPLHLSQDSVLDDLVLVSHTEHSDGSIIFRFGDATEMNIDIQPKESSATGRDVELEISSIESKETLVEEDVKLGDFGNPKSPDSSGSNVEKETLSESTRGVEVSDGAMKLELSDDSEKNASSSTTSTIKGLDGRNGADDDSDAVVVPSLGSSKVEHMNNSEEVVHNKLKDKARALSTDSLNDSFVEVNTIHLSEGRSSIITSEELVDQSAAEQGDSGLNIKINSAYKEVLVSENEADITPLNDIKLDHIQDMETSNCREEAVEINTLRENVSCAEPEPVLLVEKSCKNVEELQEETTVQNSEKMEDVSPSSHAYLEKENLGTAEQNIGDVEVDSRNLFSTEIGIDLSKGKTEADRLEYKLFQLRGMKLSEELYCPVSYFFVMIIHD